MATKKNETMDENLTLAQKLKIKVSEAMDSEKDLDPIAAERVNQIVNDAVAGMPLANASVAEKPELVMAERAKASIEAAVAAGTVPKELASKIESLLADVEAAYKAGSQPLQPVEQHAPAADEPDHPAPRKKS